MASGPDVITYIGVPLAVLGVLPIIYNTITTLATLAKVRRALRHGRLTGITRGDVINNIIEVELPRYTITPLHRSEHKQYWQLCDHPSKIPGGSWTIFNWKANTIGLKTQRIDYSDQLRQPQAEIEFEELISFLLDLGAIPDPSGFRMLRGSGLWVPAGTPLLRSPDKHEKVLFIAPLDDSDGHLSLSVQWSSDWGMRDHNSLPPYWVLIKGLSPEKPNSIADDAPDIKKGGFLDEEKNVALSHTALDNENTPHGDIFAKHITSKYMPVVEVAQPAIRCQIGLNGLNKAVPDDFDTQMFDDLDIRHLEAHGSSPTSAGMWFACAVTALGTTSQTILWNYRISADILSFSKSVTIPCGILVLLGIVEESSTPEWATQYNDVEEEREAQVRQMREQSRAMQREGQFPPDQRAQAVRERHMKSHDDWVDSHNARRRRETQRAEARMVEALQSPKWDNRLIAEHALTYLQKAGHVKSDHDLKRTVEVLLCAMIRDVQLANDLVKMLDGWKSFVDNGGIKKADYLVLKEDVMMFAYATLILALIEDSVTAASGSLAMDLQECVRIWKKVRLG